MAELKGDHGLEWFEMLWNGWSSVEEPGSAVNGNRMELHAGILDVSWQQGLDSLTQIKMYKTEVD